jgi:fructose-bisphosphate aldolase class I
MPTKYDKTELYSIAKKIMTPGKGILASDERPSSADKNLKKAGIEPSPEIRRKYRELFINTPRIEKYINGVILSDETFWQKDSEGKLFRETLQEKDILVAIKVDEGTIDMPGFPGEKITMGLEGLPDRLTKYKENGASLAKWRAVINIGEGIPTFECINTNSVSLAEYARMCQKEGIVPIVEPDVLIKGDHTLERAEEANAAMLTELFVQLDAQEVDLKGLILKTGMILPGQDSKQEVTTEQIAEATVRTLMSCVPKKVAGIVFLSGGQSPMQATQNLDSIADLEPLPWEISFSFLRAIEGPATEVWGGKDENVEKAREEFIKRLKLETLAEEGEYEPSLENK